MQAHTAHSVARVLAYVLAASSAAAMLYVGLYQSRGVQHLWCPVFGKGCEVVADVPSANITLRTLRYGRFSARVKKCEAERKYPEIRSGPCQDGVWDIFLCRPVLDIRRCIRCRTRVEERGVLALHAPLLALEQRSPWNA